MQPEIEGIKITVAHFNASPTRGLSSAAAQARLAADGPNELSSVQARGIPAMAWDVAKEPMFLLLVACGALYLVLGEPREAAVLLIFVLIVMGMTLYQEQRTERAVAALRDLASPRALVLRDGERRRIPGREVVRGDWVVLSEGDRVPADGLLVDANQLSVDEALLTGESVPVRKRIAGPEDTLSAPGGENTPAVYAGTLVVGGQGIAQIVATGTSSEIGKIGQSLRSVETARSPLQQQGDKLVRYAAIGAVSLALFVTVAYGFTRDDWLRALLAGIALAMSLLPQEFTVVMLVYLALGAWRLTRFNVLARHTAAVETLGATTVLCTDKTGTLTENRMTVRSLVDAQGERVDLNSAPLAEHFHPLVEFALLSTRSDPFDPMERAINELGLGPWVDDAHRHKDWRMVRGYPLSQTLLAMSQVWDDAQTGRRVIAAKGAPEAIISLCHLQPERAATILETVQSLADDGLRVLAVASAEATHDSALNVRSTLPGEQHAFAFNWLGLVALADPVREGVPQAVAACRRAGIRALMITGDYPGTARAVALQAGWPADLQCVTGSEIDAMDEANLCARMPRIGIVARAVPETKLRLVRALQANGDVVTMTGDGVNDAPALRAADVGVAMGGRGTDVAREAADLVVTDDNFSSIVQGVRLGRRIFDNLKHAMGYIVSAHVPIAGMAILPVLFGLPLVLLPAHIAFLEIVIDPACAVIFEAETSNDQSMSRAPRPRSASLFGEGGLLRGVVYGMLAMVAALAVFLTGHYAGLPEGEVRALAFVMLVLGNLSLILAHRAQGLGMLASLRSSNPAFWIVSAGALLLLGLVLYVPILSSLFQFEAPAGNALLACVGVALLLLPLFALSNKVIQYGLVKWKQPKTA